MGQVLYSGHAKFNKWADLNLLEFIQESFIARTIQLYGRKLKKYQKAKRNKIHSQFYTPETTKANTLGYMCVPTVFMKES